MPQKIDIPTIKKLVKTAPDKACDLRDTELNGFIIRRLPSGSCPLYAQIGRGSRELLYHEQGNGKKKNKKTGDRNVDASDILERSKTGISLRWCRQEVKRLQGSETDFVAERRAEKIIPTWKTYREEIYRPWLEDNPDHRQAEKTLARLKKCFSEFDELKMDEITPRRADTNKHKSIKAGLKPETVNRDITALKSALARYEKWNTNFINPLKGYKLIKVDRNKEIVRAFTENEVEALRVALEKREEKIKTNRASGNQWREERKKKLLPVLGGNYIDSLRPAVEISLATGLRRGELFSLTWPHVDLKKSEIRIKGENTKSFLTRIMPLSDHTISILREWKLQQGRTQGNLVFPGENGGRLTSLTKSFYPVIKDAGIERVKDDISLNWHSLRHTFGTQLGQTGVDPATIKELMGHADLKTTQRYLHSDIDRKREAIEKIA